ncbi:uncharacterized protein TNCV_3665611 [Trichonephila clavipes]|nr:uncharacterized protein TNCV_3665611 [Trichonephila clavipes]
MKTNERSLRFGSDSVPRLMVVETKLHPWKNTFVINVSSILPTIYEKIELREDLKSRRGLAVSLEIICHNCGESTSTMSSKISNKCYDVNLRLTYGIEDSMNAAVHEAVIANDNNSNIIVAVDGTWHKRGYSSLNGVVCATSVENGKVIDFEALTKYCSS